MIYLTSDTHFGHANIIEYSKRPYRHVDEMDEALVENWNRVVTPKDVVYHLGDVIFSRNHSILRRLNGHINYLYGNHDKSATWPSRDYEEIKYDGQLFVLCHYPLLTWNKARRGSIHCHGHCHGTVNHLNTDLKRFDVGVDCYNYAPVSVEQIIYEAEKKPVKDAREYD